MRKEYFIIVMLELGLKTESEVESPTLLLHCILEVANVFTVSLPSDPRLIISLLFRVNKRFHSLIVRALRLY